MLELKHISKKFEDRILFDDLHFLFPNEGLIGIQGESGCGKSTLLYMIGMLDETFDGEVIYNGDVIEDGQAFIKEHVSFMMQDNDLISSLTVKENILLPCIVSDLKYHGSELKKLSQQLEIYEYLSKFPDQLSGGQKKRVSIVKALMKHSSILLCDEPTGALHHQQAHEVMKLLKKVSQDTLVIVVSHDPALLKDYCDHVLTLKDGQLHGHIDIKNHDKVAIKSHHQWTPLWFYPVRQFIAQKNKLIFLFLFQWIVIAAFFLIATAMNGLFDAIEQSEKTAVQVNMITIERQDGLPFQKEISLDHKALVSYQYHLELLNCQNNQKDIKCIISFLPQQTNHIVLQQGKIPQKADEMLISFKLYQTLEDKKTIRIHYEDYIQELTIVGVIKDDFFSQQEIYCHLSLRKDIPFLKDDYTLLVESQNDDIRSLYQDLSQNYFAYNDVIERVDGYQSLLSLMKVIAMVFIGVSFFVSLLLIMIVESTIYLERKHDVAYLMSLGMSHMRLLKISLIESLGLGAVIAVGGSIVSSLIYYYINHVYHLESVFGFSLQLHKIFLSRYDLYMIIVVCYMVMTLMASFLPLMKMMHLDMIEVLREE